MRREAPAAHGRGSDGPGRDERGSGSVLASMVLALIVTATLAVAVLGGLLVQQRRLEAAADLAALAGAGALQRGQDGCAAAVVTARHNDATVARCSTQGAVLELVVSKQVRLPLAGSTLLRAPARAGPARPAPGVTPVPGVGPSAEGRAPPQPPFR